MIERHEARIEASINVGLSLHDWEAFETQAGDLPEAVSEAIRAAVEHAISGLPRHEETK